MDQIVRGKLEALQDWDAAPPSAIDSYKLVVWLSAITAPWLVIATVALVSLRVLG